MNRFKPINLALHNQDLTDVMALVDEMDHPVAQAIYKIANAGHIHSLDEKQLEATRKDRSLFSHSRDTFPGREESPFLSEVPLFESLPNIQQIKRALWTDFHKINNEGADDEMTDVEDADVEMTDAEHADIEMTDVEMTDIEDMDDESDYYFEPSLGSPQEDARAARELLKNIDNPAYRQPGSILEMYSATIDSIPSNMASFKAEGMLNRTKLKVDVSPAEDFSGVVYHEKYHMSTLLTGQKIWIAYPPLFGNRGKVLKNYEEVVAGDAPMDTFTRLEHGIAIIQKPGQTVAIPPLWLFTQFCAETSISCNYNIETARQFHKRFRNGNAKLFVALTHIWPPFEEQQQFELLRYVTNFVEYLGRILTNSVKGFNTKNVVIDICRDYTSLYRSFTRVLAAINDKVQARRVEKGFQQTWMDFLEEKLKKPECRICHAPIEDLPGSGSAADRVKQHFVDVHCDDSQ